MATSVGSRNELDKYFLEFQAVLAADTNFVKFNEHNHILNSMIPFSQNQSISLLLPIDFMKSLEHVIEAALQETRMLSDIYLCLTNIFRLCRNVCATCIENQTHMHNSSRFTELTNSLLLKCVAYDAKTDELLLLMRCAVQFLGNYSSGNSINLSEIWGKFQVVFRRCLEIPDLKLREYVCMVIHLILGGCDKNLNISYDETTWELLHYCLQLAADTESENGLLVVEDCLKISNFCNNVYHKLSLAARILWLEVLLNALQRLQEDNSVTSDVPCLTDIPCVDNIHFIGADFIQQSGSVPSMTSDDSDQSQMLCTVKELECLCVASSHYKLYGSLQDNDQFVTVAVSLLRCIEDIGKQGNNVFTNVDKVSRAREVNPDHPVYGLKRDLIRLLGNMAHKHPHNQNLIRELDGIPLILDQTNIDGKNPFITQWSVFAIHNLTEENEENRCYIANLKLEGVANNQAVLDEMGLQAVTEDDKVVIKKKKLE